MCSAQQNPPRTVPGVNPATTVLYTARSTPAKALGAPLSGRVTFWAWDCLLPWLSLNPRSQKSCSLFLHSALPSPPPCLSTEALLIHQRLAMPMHPWPSHEILVGTQQGSQGGYSSDQSLRVSTRASAWWLTPQWQFRVRHSVVCEKTPYMSSELVLFVKFTLPQRVS